jgi:hypothetical protein
MRLYFSNTSGGTPGDAGGIAFPGGGGGGLPGPILQLRGRWRLREALVISHGNTVETGNVTVQTAPCSRSRRVSKIRT